MSDLERESAESREHEAFKRATLDSLTAPVAVLDAHGALVPGSMMSQ